MSRNSPASACQAMQKKGNGLSIRLRQSRWSGVVGRSPVDCGGRLVRPPASLPGGRLRARTEVTCLKWTAR